MQYFLLRFSFSVISSIAAVYREKNAEALLFTALVCINPVVFSFTDFTVSDILFLLLSLSALVITDGLESVYVAARQGHTVGSYSRASLPDPIRSGTASSSRSRSFRLDQALSRFNLLCISRGSICSPVVALG